MHRPDVATAGKAEAGPRQMRKPRLLACSQAKEKEKQAVNERLPDVFWERTNACLSGSPICTCSRIPSVSNVLWKMYSTLVRLGGTSMPARGQERIV